MSQLNYHQILNTILDDGKKVRVVFGTQEGAIRFIRYFPTFVSRQRKVFNKLGMDSVFEMGKLRQKLDSSEDDCCYVEVFFEKKQSFSVVIIDDLEEDGVKQDGA